MKTNRHSHLARRSGKFFSALFCFVLAGHVQAHFHAMQIEQIIGGVNGDTTAQAIQLRMRAAEENLVAGAELIVFDAAGNNPVTLITIPDNVGSVSGGRILITTANFSSHEATPIGADFTLSNAIPPSYLAAGRLTYRMGPTVYWSVSWGGTAYTGPNTGAFDNDADGNFGPPFAGALPSSSTTALRFSGTPTAPSTSNAADYALTNGAATFTNNAGASASLGPAPTPTPVLPRIGGGPVRVELQTIATGLTAPIDLISAGDGTGRLFVVNQTGQILILKNGQLNATPFLDVSGRLVPLSANYDERGLLGLAFHPGFGNPSSPGYRRLYTYTSEPVAGAADFTVPMNGAFDHQSVLTEWQVSGGNSDVADPNTRREIMRIDQPQSNHNGGKLAFRPSDNYLYISLGDGGAGNDVGPGHEPSSGNGQDVTTALGKILRIDPLHPALTPGSSDTRSANEKYRVPVSNPFRTAAQKSPLAPYPSPTPPPDDDPDPDLPVAEIYAYGFRNPFRFSFDAVADKLIVGDVGQNHVEEIDIVEPGKNYGWNRKEGTFLFNRNTGGVSPDPSPHPGLTNPIAQYSHDDGIAVLGGFVYRGAGVPALQGKYVFADFVNPGTTTGRLFYLDDLTAGAVKELRIGNVERALGFFVKGLGRDDNGEIYICVDGSAGTSGAAGRILKIIPVPAAPALVNLSTRLRVQVGDNVLIGGFILIGSAPKTLMLRAIGPSLTANNQPLPGRLNNPTLTLFDGAGNSLMTNDDWMNSPQKQQIIDSTIAPVDPQESAILATLQPGNYTAIMSGAGGTTGIGVVELYDLDESVPANALNISTRGFVETGDNVMIGGFFVGGSQSRTVLVRTLGPSLTALGVPNALQDPLLELRDATGALLASNDHWRSDQETEITAVGLAPGDNREAAILSVPLTAGNYTAIVRGSGNTTGVALVEIYQLP